MDTQRGKRLGGAGGGVMNWAIGIDMYTLMSIKLMTNKDLLYKKINKIKFKKKKDCKGLQEVILSITLRQLCCTYCNSIRNLR